MRLEHEQFWRQSRTANYLGKKFPASDYHRFASNRDLGDSPEFAIHSGVEQTGATDFIPLGDFNFLTPDDPPVAGEPARQRSGGRAGRGILRDPGRGREHACLPPAATARDAIDAENGR
jgi:hypothetical protein